MRAPRHTRAIAGLALVGGLIGGLVGGGTAPASHQLPRAGYWEARIGSGGPVIRILIARDREHVLALRATERVVCPDGSRRSDLAIAGPFPISGDGRFDVSHSESSSAFEHPNSDRWQFRGQFTSPTHLEGTVSFVVHVGNDRCTSAPDRRTWAGNWRVYPRLSVSPRTVRRRDTLTIRGTGFLPRRAVRVMAENKVVIEGAHVDDQTYSARADSAGRFTKRIRIASDMLIHGPWRAQASQLTCTTTCWIYAEAFYHTRL